MFPYRTMTTTSTKQINSLKNSLEDSWRHQEDWLRHQEDYQWSKRGQKLRKKSKNIWKFCQELQAAKKTPWTGGGWTTLSSHFCQSLPESTSAFQYAVLGQSALKVWILSKLKNWSISEKILKSKQKISLHFSMLFWLRMHWKSGFWASWTTDLYQRKQ